MFYHYKLLFILLWSCSIEPSHSMVSICQNVSIVATEFRLGRTISDSANCSCRLVSTNNMTNKVQVQNSPLVGCQYRLLVDYEGKHSYYSCDTKQTWTTTATMDIEIFNFKLEPYKPTHDGADFTLNISSLSDANLTLTCFIPTLKTSTHLPSSTTQWTSSITTLPSRINTTNGVLMNKAIMSGIGIGCFTGGIIVGVLCLLGIIRCRRSRNEEDNSYSSTSTCRNEEDLHTYSEAGDAENNQRRTKRAFNVSVPQESFYENISK